MSRTDFAARFLHDMELIAKCERVGTMSVNSDFAWQLHLAGIQRETPWALFENNTPKGTYVWITRDYERIHWVRI